MKRESYLLNGNNLITYFSKPECSNPDIDTLNREKTLLSICTQNRNAYASDATHSFEDINSVANLLSRPYNLSEMINAQNLLHTLDIFESIKYKEHNVLCRPLLRKYLYSAYDLLSCYLNDTNVRNNINSSISTKELLKLGKMTYAFPDELNTSDPKSVRNYFQQHLTGKIISYSTYGIQIAKSETEKSTNSQKEHYYLPVTQILEFLLLFTYADGRNYSSTYIPNTNSRLPRLDGSRPKSAYSYKLVLQQIVKLLDSPRLNQYSQACHLYRLDKLFLFAKIGTMNEYYNLYNSDYFLSNMVISFRLSYSEVSKLKSILADNLWNDTSFIHDGMKSSCLDFMLPFDIHFQFELFTANMSLSYSTGLLGLNRLIEECKKEARKIWELCSTPNFNLQNYINASGLIDIPNLQAELYDTLMNNNFYKNYCTISKSFLHRYISSSEPLQQPIIFEELQKHLPK